MATPNTANVAVGSALVTGAIYVADVTVALPTSASAALASGYACIGFTSEDGVTITEDSSTTSLRAWEGRAEVRNIRTEYTEKISFTPIECNEEVAKLMWGSDKVTVGTGGALTIKHHGGTLDPVHVVIETVPCSGKVARYCAKVQLTERGDATLNGEDTSGREGTFNCIPDSAGVTMTEYVATTTTTTTTGA